MKCRELAEFLIDYVSGELPEDTRVTFELHLTRCRNCHAYLIQYQAIVKAGKLACDEHSDELPTNVPEDLVKAVLSARKLL
jgi:anti-sigma factor RsiW